MESPDDLITIIPSDSIESTISCVLSKNQLKRTRKIELYAEKKASKRLKEKEKKKEKKLKNPKILQVNDDKREFHPDPSETVLSRGERKEIAKNDFLELCASSYSVIIDCAWENCHTERQHRSLCQQLSHCYGFNRKHQNPASLYLFGVGAKVHESLTRLNYNSWIGVSHSPMEYIESDFFTSKLASDDITSATDYVSKSNRIKKLVYLTSDSETTIETLDPNCAYIIGGIVDRNHHKGATFEKAIAQGIETAKLPIREHISMNGTHILTVNHVLEILLNFSTLGSWAEAVKAVIPERKIKKPKKDTMVEVAVDDDLHESESHVDNNDCDSGDDDDEEFSTNDTDDKMTDLAGDSTCIQSVDSKKI